MGTHAGSCLCGAVAYEFDDPVVQFCYCHCPRCRKATGSAHAANLFVRPDQFRWTRGREQVRRYDLPEAKRFAKCFCATCGSPLPHATRAGDGVIIPAGSLDADPGVKPQCGIWWSARAPWYVSTVDLEQYEEGLR